MKQLLKNPQIIKGIICGFILGIIIGYDIDSNFIHLYIAKMGQIPVRYSLIILILFVDFLVFEDINHYIYIFRYKSIKLFMKKSILLEIFMTIILLIILHLPIILLNIQTVYNYISLILLSIINIVLVISLILMLIRFINIWINNRLLATGMFMIMMITFDVILDHFSFFQDKIIFTFKDILVLPFIYPSYSIIAGTMILMQFILFDFIKKMMIKKDYILKQNETSVK